MTPSQFKTAIAKLSLTQEGAGLWLGLSPRQGQRYANGEQEIPGPVEIATALTIHFGLTPEQARAIVAKVLKKL